MSNLQYVGSYFRETLKRERGVENGENGRRKRLGMEKYLAGLSIKRGQIERPF